MDFKKVLDQTVREIKREVNKKVLKVPEIEQKVLDATSNEPWGPHGTVMSEIAHATRNYYEYQMIMTILWKRLTDTGRNWRHVYKALTLLEYLVSHGSERVIDEIRENSHKISTLSDFQFLEPNGKDQGINVRKKSQTLLVLVNDKEKIKEVRQKAIENRDKYRGVSSTGAMHKSSSYSGGFSGDRYDDDGYGSGSRYGSRDDNKYSKDKDSDYNDDWKKADDKYKGYDKGFDDDHSARGSGGRDDEYHQDDWKSSQKQQTKMPPPPSYEESHTSPDYQQADKSRDGLNAQNKSFDDDDDDFDPRAAPKPAPPQPAPLLATDDLFGSAEFVGSTSSAPSQTNNFDFFGDSPSSSFTSIPAASNLQESSPDLFGNSPFKVDTPVTSSSVIPPPPKFSPHMTNSVIPPPPKFAAPNMKSGTSPSVTATSSFNSFDAFATAPQQAAQTSFVASGNATANTLGHNDFDAFFSAPSSGNQSSSSGGIGAFDAFSTNPPPVSQAGGDDFFGANVFNSSIPTVSSHPNTTLGQGSSVSKAQTEKKFETKSSVWADSLSKGLIDLNISGPKTNPLGEIGIDFDLLRTDKKNDDRTTNNRIPGTGMGMGKAMGSGSGLGVAGASSIARPPNPMMGMNAMGINPMMGVANPMGMGQSMGATPMMQMGMNPGMAMRPGTTTTMGTGINQGMNMGGYQNQQQQYNGFM